MNIKYRVIVKDDKVENEEYFEDICCREMEKALLSQETPLANPKTTLLWLYCPFCKEEIIY